MNKHGLVTIVNHLWGQGKIGEEQVSRVLRGLGLTEKEKEVYIFLAKHGVQKGTDVAKRMGMHKAEAYRFLKSLQCKNLVESTLEAPVRFTAIPFATALDAFVKAKRDEAALIENARKELLLDWEKISRTKPELPLEKFVVIDGRSQIYSRILQMIKEAKNQLSVASNTQGLFRADQSGVFDAIIEHPLRSKIKFRFLSETSDQHANAVKALLERTQKSGVNLRARNPNLGLSLSPRMIIKDDEEMILFTAPAGAAQTQDQDAMCLWTNSRTLVVSFTAVFEDLWRNSTEFQEKKQSEMTGKYPWGSVPYMAGETANKEYQKESSSAKKEVKIVTSSQGVLDLNENKSTLTDFVRRGLDVEIMAPIVGENFNAAKEISEICQIRHIPEGYIRTTLFDESHLFHFPADGTICIPDATYVDRINEMLEDTWKNAMPPSAVTLESIINPPTPPSELAEANMPHPVFSKGHLHYEDYVEGTVTEKEVIAKIMNAKRITAKDPRKDINTEYGSNAYGIIHPPDFFNLPDMMINIWHANKQSSFGAEDWFIVRLWLETPNGYRYVPVVHVTDNPEAAEFRKFVYKFTPAGENSILVNKDQFHVVVQGNTLFAGWTIPIKLFPPRYVLPPSCIQFEAYGSPRSGTSKTSAPSGRTQVQEFNRYDAFVTYFHPSSKYSGPGIDGIFNRDIILTAYPPRNTNKE